jgi:hypothetical protein
MPDTAAPPSPLLLVITDTGNVRHDHKKRVLSTRADLPTRISLRGYSVHVWLHWPFGLRHARAHGLLSGSTRGSGCVATQARACQIKAMELSSLRLSSSGVSTQQ